MRTLALSGWGQPHDALAAILPDATHFDYARHDSMETAIAAIAAAAKNHARVVGWSLGGQLAVRAIAKGIVKPKRLVLIGVPFQFIRNDRLKLGLPRDTYDMFCANYKNNPERTMKKSWELIAYGDTREAEVKAQLAKQDRKKVLENDWQRWFTMLSDFSCDELDFSEFPPTLVIHGDKDAVVWHEQAAYFIKRLPHSRLETFSGCGHAPHWHDTKKCRELMKNHV
jgi:pimeloyl-[acyl-carrier protein] methyl ester esterase